MNDKITMICDQCGETLINGSLCCLCRSRNVVAINERPEACSGKQAFEEYFNGTRWMRRKSWIHSAWIHGPHHTLTTAICPFTRIDYNADDWIFSDTVKTYY